ncbi:unnamed protein product [Owenia fusiformis]|uniref:Uncharacterized protein n=1 Tax=Owenia fusiformis TaxID=6347 RepID=A0A8J1XR60_OWEFU|nr:unnamed protein product [Owenia fusiformis]
MHVTEMPLYGEHSMGASEEAGNVGAHHTVGPSENTRGDHERVENGHRASVPLETIASDPSTVCEAICQEAHKTGVNYLQDLQKKAALNNDNREYLGGEAGITNYGCLDQSINKGLNKSILNDGGAHGYFNRMAKEQRRSEEATHQIPYQTIDPSYNKHNGEQSTLRMYMSAPKLLRGVTQPLDLEPEGQGQTTVEALPQTRGFYPMYTQAETALVKTKPRRRKRKIPMHIDEGLEYRNNNGNVNESGNVLVVDAFVNAMKQRKASQGLTAAKYDQQRTPSMFQHIPQHVIPYPQRDSQSDKIRYGFPPSSNEGGQNNKNNSNSNENKYPHQPGQHKGQTYTAEAQYQSSQQLHHHIRQSIQQQIQNPQYYKEKHLFNEMHGLGQEGEKDDQDPHLNEFSIAKSKLDQYWKTPINATSNAGSSELLPAERTPSRTQIHYTNGSNYAKRQYDSRPYDQDEYQFEKSRASFMENQTQFIPNPIDRCDTRKPSENGARYPNDKFQPSRRRIECYEERNDYQYQEQNGNQYQVPIAECQLTNGNRTPTESNKIFGNMIHPCQTRDSNISADDLVTRVPRNEENENEPIPRHNVIYFPSAEDRLHREQMVAQCHPYVSLSNGQTRVSNSHPGMIVNGHNPETNNRPLNYRNGPPPLYKVIPSTMPQPWKMHEVRFPPHMYQDQEQIKGHRRNRKQRAKSNDQIKVGKGTRKRGRPRKNASEGSTRKDIDQPSETTKEQGFPKKTMLNYIPLDLSTNKKVQRGSDVPFTILDGDQSKETPVVKTAEEGTENRDEIICNEDALSKIRESHVDSQESTGIPAKHPCSSSSKPIHSFQDAFLQFQQRDTFSEHQEESMMSWHTPTNYFPKATSDHNMLKEAEPNSTDDVQTLPQSLRASEKCDQEEKQEHGTVANGDHPRKRRGPKTEIQIIDGQETIVCYIDEEDLKYHNRELMAKLSSTDSPEVVKRLLAKPIETQQELLAATSKMVPYNSEVAKQNPYNKYMPFSPNHPQHPRLPTFANTEPQIFQSTDKVQSIPFQDANNNKHLQEQIKNQKIMNLPQTHMMNSSNQKHRILPSYMPTFISNQIKPQDHSSPLMPTDTVICKLCGAKYNNMVSMEKHFIYFHKTEVQHENIEVNFASDANGQNKQQVEAVNTTATVPSEDGSEKINKFQDSIKTVATDVATEAQNNDRINPPFDTPQDDESKIAAETLISLQSRPPSELRFDEQLRLLTDDIDAANVLVDMKHNTPQVSPVKQIPPSTAISVDKSPDKGKGVVGENECSQVGHELCVTPGPYHQNHQVQNNVSHGNDASNALKCDTLKNLASSTIDEPISMNLDKRQSDFIKEPCTTGVTKKARKATVKRKKDQIGKPSVPAKSSQAKKNKMNNRINRIKRNSSPDYKSKQRKQTTPSTLSQENVGQKRKNTKIPSLGDQSDGKSISKNETSDNSKHKTDNIERVNKSDSIILKPNKKYGKKSFFRISLKKSNSKNNLKKKKTTSKTTKLKPADKHVDKEIENSSNDVSDEKETTVTSKDCASGSKTVKTNETDILNHENNKNDNIKKLETSTSEVRSNGNGKADSPFVTNVKNSEATEVPPEDTTPLEKHVQYAVEKTIITDQTTTKVDETTNQPITEETEIEESEETFLDLEDELPDIADDGFGRHVVKGDKNTGELIIKNINDTETEQYLAGKSMSNNTDEVTEMKDSDQPFHTSKESYEEEIVEELITFGNDFTDGEESLGIKVISTFSLATHDGTIPPELALEHGLSTDQKQSKDTISLTGCERENDSNSDSNKLIKTSPMIQSAEPLNEKNVEKDSDVNNSSKIEMPNEMTNRTVDGQENENKMARETVKTSDAISDALEAKVNRVTDEENITIDKNDTPVSSTESTTIITENLTLLDTEVSTKGTIRKQEINDPSGKQDRQVSSSHDDQNLSSRLNVFDILSATKSDDEKMSSSRTLRINSAPMESIEPDTPPHTVYTSKDHKLDTFLEKAKRFGQMLKKESSFGDTSPIKQNPICERSFSENFPRYEVISKDISKRQTPLDTNRAVKLKRNARKSTRSSNWVNNFNKFAQNMPKHYPNDNVKSPESNAGSKFQSGDPKGIKTKFNQSEDGYNTQPATVKKEKVLLRKNARKSGVSAAELNLAIVSLDTKRRPKQQRDHMPSQTEKQKRGEVSNTLLPLEKRPKLSRSSDTMDSNTSDGINKVDTLKNSNESQTSSKTLDSKPKNNKTGKKRQIDDTTDQLQQLIGIVTKRTEKLKKPVQQQAAPKNNAEMNGHKKKSDKADKPITEQQNTSRNKTITKETNKRDIIKQTMPNKEHTVNGFSHLRNMFSKAKETEKISDQAIEKRDNETKAKPSVQQTVEGFSHLKDMLTKGKATIEQVEPTCPNDSDEDEGNLFEIPIKETLPIKENYPHANNHSINESGIPIADNSHKELDSLVDTTKDKVVLKTISSRKMSEDDNSSDDEKEKIKCQNLLMKLQNLRAIARKSYEKQIEGKYSGSSDDESDDDVIEVSKNNLQKLDTPDIDGDSDDELPDILKEMTAKHNTSMNKPAKQACATVKSTMVIKPDNAGPVNSKSCIISKKNVSTSKRRKRCPSERHNDDLHSFDVRTKPCKVLLKDISKDIKYKDAMEFMTIKLSKCYGLPKYGLSDQDEIDQREKRKEDNKKNKRNMKQNTGGSRLKNINCDSVSSESSTAHFRNKGTGNERAIKRNKITCKKQSIQDDKRMDGKQSNEDNGKTDIKQSERDIKVTGGKQGKEGNEETDKNQSNGDNEETDNKQSNEDKKGTAIKQTDIMLCNKDNKEMDIKQSNEKNKGRDDIKQDIGNNEGTDNKQSNEDSKGTNNNQKNCNEETNSKHSNENNKKRDSDVMDPKDEHSIEFDEPQSDDGNESDASESTIPFDIVSFSSSLSEFIEC